MRGLALLAVILAAAFGTFLVRGLPALAARDRAGRDLLARERTLREEQGRLATVSDGEFNELARRRERAASLAERRLASLIPATPGTDEATGSPGSPEDAQADLERRLASSHHPQLRPDGARHDQVLAVARRGPDAARALGALVAALDTTSGPLDLEVLELRAEGSGSPLPGVPELERIEAQLVLTGSLPDDLAILEALAPVADGQPPIATVTLASLRRVEPERWGGGLHRLATPPVRLSVSLELLLPSRPEER